MTASATVLVHPDPDVLTAAAAARLITRLVDVQTARGRACLVLTGGGIGIAILRSVASSAALPAVNWRQVEMWWGDERFLPAGDPQRNDTQAKEALLAGLDLDPALVHPVPGPDDPRTPDPEAAAQHYAEELAAAAGGSGVPAFDVLLLGVGPEGHTASIFPETPAASDERAVIGVRGCPKPPPLRVSLTFSSINRAREVWIAAAGTEKAGVIGLALAGAGRVQVPVAGVAGQERTLWLLDRAAASELPETSAGPAGD